MNETPPQSSSTAVLWMGRLLPVVGIGLLLLVLWRQQQLDTWSTQPASAKVAPRALAPRFELADHNRKFVKFERFLGRQRVVVVFFDAELGADQDPRVRPLIDHFEAIDAEGFEVIAISTATPYANGELEKRLPSGEFPFPIITDIDHRNPIPNPTHREWGAYDEKSDTPKPAMFLVARDGSIPIGPDRKPLSVRNEEATIQMLIQGEWPR